MFAENIRDGFEIDPIEVQIHPEYGDKYRILDGAHRWHHHSKGGHCHDHECRNKGKRYSN